MVIRRATKEDVPQILNLLQQVLELHARIRPDIFLPGTTKYTASELEDMVREDEKPIYVAAEEERILGYAFCQIREQPFANNMVPFTSLFIDDLCTEEAMRGKQVGRKLFEFVKGEAKRLGCYEVTLNVWEGNEAALRFYERMGMQVKERQMEVIL